MNVLCLLSIGPFFILTALKFATCSAEFTSTSKGELIQMWTGYAPRQQNMYF